MLIARYAASKPQLSAGCRTTKVRLHFLPPSATCGSYDLLDEDYGRRANGKEPIQRFPAGGCKTLEDGSDHVITCIAGMPL